MTSKDTACSEAGESAVSRLYYSTASGHSGRDRRLHVDADCRHLALADNVRSCDVTHPPRGELCSDCGDGRSLDDLHAATQDARARTDGGHATPEDHQ